MGLIRKLPSQASRSVGLGTQTRGRPSLRSGISGSGAHRREAAGEAQPLEEERLGGMRESGLLSSGQLPAGFDRNLARLLPARHHT